MPSYKANVVHKSNDLCTIVAPSKGDLEWQLGRLAKALGIAPSDEPDLLWADVFKNTRRGWVRDKKLHHNDG